MRYMSVDTKNISKEQAEEMVSYLRKRVDFNNLLNKHVRKFMKDKPHFNGYHDEPTEEMRNDLLLILSGNALCDMSWMDLGDKKEYASYCREIYGQVYSPAVNTYILERIHRLEKHIETLSSAEGATKEEHGDFTVERDLESNRVNIRFDSIPEPEVRATLKSNGFRWSPYLSAWTRTLTGNAEYSLSKVIKELEGND